MKKLNNANRFATGVRFAALSMRVLGRHGTVEGNGEESGQATGSANRACVCTTPA
jgi:hypothetical protein